MNKQGISLGRVLTISGFALSCFGLLLFLWLAFGGPIPLQPKGYRFQVALPDAATLAEQADVRVAGVGVGTVVAKRRDPRGNRTLATIELDERFAPVRRDARALLRQKTLLGETYVEMTLGSRGAPVLPEGGRLPASQVEEVVEFDELLRTFDRPTRLAFQEWQRSMALATRGRGPDLNDALGNLPAFVEQAGDVVDTLDDRREALGSLIRGTGDTFAALSRDEAALRRLVTRQAQVFATLSARGDALADTFRVLPTFLRESRATLARLEGFAEDTEPLVRGLEPVLADVGPTVRSLRELAPDAQALFADLDPLIDAGRPGLPALGRVLRGLDPALGSTGTFLRQLNPLLQFLELNQAYVADFLNLGPTAVGYLADRPEGEAGAETAGHALGQLVVTGEQSATRLDRRGERNRGNAYLGPEALAGLGGARFKAGFFTFPNWDCETVPGGERRARGDVQGCFVQGAYARGLTAYPRVEAARPGGGGPPLGMRARPQG